MKRAELVEKKHPKLSVREQCKILGVSRSVLNYKPVEESAEDTRIMRILDEIYTMDPSIGSRRLTTLLERDHGIKVNRKRLQRLRREKGKKEKGSVQHIATSNRGQALHTSKMS